MVWNTSRLLCIYLCVFIIRNILLSPGGELLTSPLLPFRNKEASSINELEANVKLVRGYLSKLLQYDRRQNIFTVSVCQAVTVSCRTLMDTRTAGCR